MSVAITSACTSHATCAFELELSAVDTMRVFPSRYHGYSFLTSVNSYIYFIVYFVVPYDYVFYGVPRL